MRKFLFLLAGLLTYAGADAQVRGVSYTIAPSAAYNWFDDASGLDDAFMFGGRLGFGFGEFVELRATYLQTIDQQTDFAGLGIGIDSTFGDQGVDLRRYGAELKLNVGRGNLLPYVLIGGGIQDTEREGLERAENIFGTLGLGLTLSAADRYTFGVEGKYIAYSGNTVQNLFDEAERQANDLSLTDFDTDQIGTFAVAANLQFYLGGRRPGQLSEIDEEYLRNFEGGLRGLSIPIELGGARVEWDESLPYRDAYFAGGTAGFNFGPLVSLRGFYYQGMTDDEINFDFDDIALYGADFRFNLTQASSGLVPYLNVGGGYIDLASGYNDGVTDITQVAQSQGFASGGGGLYLKFGERFTINGGARALLTTGSDLEDLNSTEQITTSMMYNAGLALILGGKNRDRPDVVRQSTFEDELDQQQQQFERRADSIRMENQMEIAELRERYQDTIAVLDQELIDALDAGDVETAAIIKEEREDAALIVDELDARQAELDREGIVDEQQRRAADQAEIDAALGRPVRPIPRDTYPSYYGRDDRRPTGDGSMILLREDQINRLIDAVGGRPGNYGSGGVDLSTNERINDLNRRLDRMEDRLSGVQAGRSYGNDYRNDPDYRQMSPEERRIEDLERRIDALSRGDDVDDQDPQRRIQDLEEQLQRSLERRDDNREDMRDDIDGEPRDIDELEERLMERLDRMRDGDDDTEEMRQEMLRDMTDYQSEMMREIRSLQSDLDRANRELARRERQEDLNNERLDLERERLRMERREARRERQSYTVTDTAGNRVVVPGTRSIDEIEINTGGVYLADDNTEGFFSNFTYTGMSGTAGLNFGDATGLGLGLRWHYKLGPQQRAEFMPEAYFGIGAPTTFGIFGNLIYPIITETTSERGLIPYAGLGAGFMQIEDDEEDGELNFRPAVNLVVGTYLPFAGGRVFADFSTRNFFSVNQLTAGYRFNF